MASLHLQNIEKSLMGETIVENFNLDLAAGEVICLYGPSGCGKTTILRLIAGLIRPDRGQINSDFQRLRYLFQEHRLLPWRSLWDNILLTHPQPNAAKTQEQARLLLTKLHLHPEDYDKYPDELSGGMRQRAALVRALLCQPDLLLLDEPFSALDYELKLQLYDWLQSYITNGMSVVMVTHDRFEALQLADKIYILPRKPARNHRLIELDRPRGQRDQEFIRHYLAQPFWQAYHD
ncbi:Fe(3+) ions import ATP-binding protein FbpC [Oligella ureolytica]|mgnify:CR=1 FL=1|uniref:ABC transporter ATP-binding protein n=1 Tax=Oligella ureolytica TaxID=90244 RepID=UPI000DFE2956|nr:ABC transporter ATP-binding protein [Oligella ureolytica]SUA53250.1 Fe(3+) ions import ATP-binding protein FbpC [Oligella ureolytica]